MAKVERIECDNPKCSSIGVPEGKNAGPYGWLTIKVWQVGRTGEFRVDACGADCVGPACVAVWDEQPV